MTPKDMSGTLRVMNMYVCVHLDPMGAIWTKGKHMDGHQELAATTTSGGALVAADDEKQRR
jgi:hypothetical protein